MRKYKNSDEEIDSVEPEEIISDPVPQSNPSDLIKSYLMKKFNQGGGDTEAYLNRASRLISTTGPGILTRSAPIFTDKDPVSDQTDLRDALSLANYLQREDLGGRRLDEGERNRALRKELGRKSIKIREGELEHKRAQAEKKDVRDLQTELEGTEDFKKARQKKREVSNARNLLSEIQRGNGAAIEPLKTVMIRMTGDVGNIAVKEREALGGEQSIVAKLNRYATKLATGDMTPQDINDFNKIVDAFDRSAEAGLEDVYGRKTAQGVVRLGKSKEEVRKMVNPQGPNVSEMSRVSRKATSILNDPKSTPEQKAKAKKVLERIKMEMGKRGR